MPVIDFSAENEQRMGLRDIQHRAVLLDPVIGSVFGENMLHLVAMAGAAGIGDGQADANGIGVHRHPLFKLLGRQIGYGNKITHRLTRTY